MGIWDQDSQETECVPHLLVHCHDNPVLPSGEERPPALPTRDARQSHLVTFLSQVQPLRHLVNHHLDLIFIQRAENGHRKAETLAEVIPDSENNLRTATCLDGARAVNAVTS